MTDSNVKISIYCDHDYFGISTYSRENGHHGKFLLRRKLVEELLSNDSVSEIYDSDANRFITVRINKNDIVIFNLYWLSEYREQELAGLRQTFYLSKIVVERMLSRGIVTEHYLSQPPIWRADVVHTKAARTVRNALKDKRTRRALSKAMRDAFQWPGEQVVLHNDGGCNFFFTTESTFAICGGLILHEGMKNGYPAVYYSVHT